MNQEELLQKYLDGEMGEAERLAFESQLGKNPDLAERVRLHRMLEGALGNQKEMQVAADLRSIMEEADEGASVSDADIQTDTVPEPGKSRRLWPYFSAAAAVVLILLLVRFLLSGPSDPQQLYAAHYVAYDGSGEVRNGEGVPPNLLDAAFDAYDEANFSEAETAFLAILDSFPGNARAHFYLGICRLETDQFGLAVESFRTVIADGKNLYLSQAHWYLAMACLKQADLECVEAELKPLSEAPGMYREKAGEILGEM